jgi:catechol 2,3-dioxygenase-like lactoylglutathione lyase family enzyme
MFKVLQIDHVELFVPDRYDAAKWFERILGLQIVPGFEEWATGGGPLMISTEQGNTKLALFEGQPTPSVETAAFRRVAFRVTGEGFVEFLRRLSEIELLDARGRRLTPQAVVDHRQAYSIYFVDPYGHLLEITTYDHDDVSAALKTL